MEARKIMAKGRREIQAKELHLKVDEVEHIDFIGVDKNRSKIYDVQKCIDPMSHLTKTREEKAKITSQEKKGRTNANTNGERMGKPDIWTGNMKFLISNEIVS
ncbi:hypothetical protein LguiB_001673 [Lonicera macranthoides]